MKHVRHCSLVLGSPEPALAAVDRRPARHHAEPPFHRQEGQHRARQSDQLLHRGSLDNRASDINNLLDGIGNGVQVLQAANTGITSLQKLVDSAKSVANQALQATVGYSAKSQRQRALRRRDRRQPARHRRPIDATCSRSPARFGPSPTTLAETNRDCHRQPPGVSNINRSRCAGRPMRLTGHRAARWTADRPVPGARCCGVTASATAARPSTAATITFTSTVGRLL